MVAAALLISAAVAGFIALGPSDGDQVDQLKESLAQRDRQIERLELQIADLQASLERVTASSGDESANAAKQVVAAGLAAPAAAQETSDEDHDAIAEVASVAEDRDAAGVVDIARIDPESPDQQTVFRQFRTEIENYDYNERFDIQGFLSDPRLRQLDASLGGKLIDYVQTRLKGIRLMQNQDDAVHLLTEHQH